MSECRCVLCVVDESKCRKLVSIEKLEADLDKQDKDNVTLRQQLAASEASNAVMRGALGKYNDLMCMSQMAAQYGGKIEDKLKFASRRDAIAEEMVKALDATQDEAAQRVQGLVEALEAINNETENAGNCYDGVQQAVGAIDNIVKDALAAYRGEGGDN